MRKKVLFILGLCFFSLSSLYAQEQGGVCSLTGEPFKGSVCEELQIKAQKGNMSSQSMPFQNVPQFNYNPQPVNAQQRKGQDFNPEPKQSVKQQKAGVQKTKNIKGEMSFTPQLFQIPADAVQAEELSQNAFIVRPEKTTIVRLSNTDINRIVCTAGESNEVKVIFPQRKGLNVKVVDNNVFVEFQVVKEGEEYIYQETPTELYVVCDNSVYSIIGIPQRVPAVTVYLKDEKKELSKKLSALSGMPYEERIVNIVRSIFSGEAFQEASVIKVSKKYDNVIPALEIEEVENFVYDVEGLVARVFIVRMKDNVKDSYVDLREKDFLKKELTAKPQAVAIEKLRLLKGERTMVVILEKMNVIEKMSPGQGLLMGQQ